MEKMLGLRGYLGELTRNTHTQASTKYKRMANDRYANFRWVLF